MGALLVVVAACSWATACSSGEDSGGSADATAISLDTELRLDPTAYGEPGVHEVSLKVDGVERSYELRVPQAYDGSEALPLVLAFHGYTMDPGQMVDGAWGALAEEYGFVLAAPAGLDRMWSVLQDEDEADLQLPTSQVDLSIAPTGDRDVRFAAAVLADVNEFLRIDADRVLVTGESMGGFMASRVACDLGDNFAALGPNYNSLLYSVPCRTEAKFAVLSVGHELDSVHTVEDAAGAAAKWAIHNGCASEEVSESEYDVDITSFEHEGCSTATPVGMLVHRYNWPGSDDERAVWERFLALPIE